MAAANKTTKPPSSFQEAFDMFSKFGDTNSDGKTITLSQSDKWMKQAKVIDGKTVTTTDTAIAFKKFKAHRISVQDYEKFLQDLATQKKTSADTLKKNLMECGAPSLNLNMNKTPSKVSESVSRLTDQSKYTGTHKQRFDEQGKGKGIAGRVDMTDKSGYVTGYKNKDSFGKPNPAD